MARESARARASMMMSASKQQTSSELTVPCPKSLGAKARHLRGRNDQAAPERIRGPNQHMGNGHARAVRLPTGCHGESVAVVACSARRPNLLQNRLNLHCRVRSRGEHGDQRGNLCLQGHHSKGQGQGHTATHQSRQGRNPGQSQHHGNLDSGAIRGQPSPQGPGNTTGGAAEAPPARRQVEAQLDSVRAKIRKAQLNKKRLRNTWRRPSRSWKKQWQRKLLPKQPLRR